MVLLLVFGHTDAIGDAATAGLKIGEADYDGIVGKQFITSYFISDII